ncbi:hypothetical protein BKA70DRAFT_50740 [Coprinopsis sp. MPI-PUGE-AT-0042]|nr:hypothetical protein BKA70DRAFT_50740 [Coprinopsis sp. MPI-PUGE-AT-0042]
MMSAGALSLTSELLSDSNLIPAPLPMLNPVPIMSLQDDIPSAFLPSQTLLDDLHPSRPEMQGRKRSYSLPPAPSFLPSSSTPEVQLEDARTLARSCSVTQLLVESTRTRTESVHFSTHLIDGTETLLATLNEDSHRSASGTSGDRMGSGGREHNTGSICPTVASLSLQSWQNSTDLMPAISTCAPPSSTANAPSVSTTTSKATTISAIILEPRFDATAYYALALAGPAYYHEQLALGGGASSSSSYARPGVRRRRTRLLAEGQEKRLGEGQETVLQRQGEERTLYQQRYGGQRHGHESGQGAGQGSIGIDEDQGSLRGFAVGGRECRANTSAKPGISQRVRLDPPLARLLHLPFPLYRRRTALLPPPLLSDPHLLSRLPCPHSPLLSQPQLFLSPPIRRRRHYHHRRQ